MDLTVRQRQSYCKSRHGCYSCKARKTKCNEARPSCSNCNKRGLFCSYSANSTARESSRPHILRMALPSPATKTCAQAQYLNHYLNVAYPFLPSGSEKVWRTHIAQFAFHNEALMAAMLGLSAAHLHCITGQHFHYSAASRHRQQALSGLKPILSKTHWDRNDIDSALAISYLLGFQSRLMVDGLLDFFTMLRGTALLSEHVINNTSGTSFRLTREMGSPSDSGPGSLSLPALDTDCVQKGLDSLLALRESIDTRRHLDFFAALQNIFEACLKSSMDGLVEYWKLMDSAISRCFMDSDTVTKMLQTYLVALKLIMEPVVQCMYNNADQQQRVEREVRLTTIKWGQNIVQGLSRQSQVHVQWPLAVVESAAALLQQS